VRIENISKEIPNKILTSYKMYDPNNVRHMQIIKTILLNIDSMSPLLTYE